MDPPTFNQVLGEIESLSYSRFRAIRECQLKGSRVVGQASGTDRTSNRRQLAGKIFHELMESIMGEGKSRIDDRQALMRAFNKTVEAQKTRLSSSEKTRYLGDPRDWEEISLVYKGLKNLLRDKLERSFLQADKIDTEKRIYSQDGRLLGIPDVVLEVGADLEVVDYKTGLSQEYQKIREAYVEQLLFYAYLVHQNRGRFPTRMLLIGIDGTAFEVPVDASRSQEIADDMRIVQDEYNSRIQEQNGHLEGVPSLESCLYCNRKASCKNFIRDLPSLNLPDWHHAAAGWQEGSMEVSESGVARLELRIQSTSLNADHIAVHRLIPNRFPDLSDREGQALLLTNLRLTSRSPVVSVEVSESTRIFRVRLA